MLLLRNLFRKKQITSLDDIENIIRRLEGIDQHSEIDTVINGIMYGQIYKLHCKHNCSLHLVAKLKIHKSYKGVASFLEKIYTHHGYDITIYSSEVPEELKLYIKHPSMQELDSYKKCVTKSFDKIMNKLKGKNHESN